MSRLTLINVNGRTFQPLAVVVLNRKSVLKTPKNRQAICRGKVIQIIREKAEKINDKPRKNRKAKIIKTKRQTSDEKFAPIPFYSQKSIAIY